MLAADLVLHAARVVHPAFELLILEPQDLFLILELALLLRQLASERNLLLLRCFLLDLAF